MPTTQILRWSHRVHRPPRLPWYCTAWRDSSRRWVCSAEAWRTWERQRPPRGTIWVNGSGRPKKRCNRQSYETTWTKIWCIMYNIRIYERPWHVRWCHNMMPNQPISFTLHASTSTTHLDVQQPEALPLVLITSRWHQIQPAPRC